MTRNEYEVVQKRAAEMIIKSGILISAEEAKCVEVVDFGLGDLMSEGAQILTLVQTNRISIKVIALFPQQTEPEHWHPQVGDDPGKEETIRVIKGVLYLYLPGFDNMVMGQIPKNKSTEYTCRSEFVMKANDQLTIQPGCKHWFQAGNGEVVVYSFSTVAHDILDKFTDPKVIRILKIPDD